MEPGIARDLWRLCEPYHAVVYFDPETKSIYESVGLKGYWMGYFASRSAAMGPASPETVIATFYNFHPRMVRRAIPDAWRFSTPQRVLEARYRVADTALKRLLSEAVSSDEVTEAGVLARSIALECDVRGRPLFAAHAALPWPNEPHLVLWHATTLLREFRGDAHVSALMVHEIDGCECHVLGVAAGALPEQQREFRGWSEEEWQEATDRLRSRGLIDDGKLTDEGVELRNRVEALTDKLSLPPFESIGEEKTRSLQSLLQPLYDLIAGAGGIPHPNPVGLTAPRSASQGGNGSGRA